MRQPEYPPIGPDEREVFAREGGQVAQESSGRIPNEEGRERQKMELVDVHPRMREACCKLEQRRVFFPPTSRATN